MTLSPARTRKGWLAFTAGLVLLGLVACSPQVATRVASPSPSPTTTLTSFPSAEITTPDGTTTETISPYRDSFPDPGGFTWLQVFSGLEQPLDIQNAGDGSSRLFVVERTGRIRILLGGLIVPEPFLDLSAIISSDGQEQGLLGLAFHPGYATNGTFFVNYTDPGGDTVISQFRVSDGDPQRADPLSEVVLLRVEQPYTNHNGGGLAFGPDGWLYIGLGDGGSGGDPHGYAQDADSYLGKMLRLDVDSPAAEPEVWASGLRNPWRFSFDASSGDLYIADVGQKEWEEINYIPAGTPAGLNFGWNYFEGTHEYEGLPPAELGLTFPVSEYSHAEGCSITGGTVYRGVELPEWQGVYVFADYCNGAVFGLIRSGADTWLRETLFQAGVRVSTFGVDEMGELYLADFQGGNILHLVRR